jgi:cytochrome P450
MYKLKYELKGCDFMIFNILNQVVLAVINLDVMKETLTPDKVDIYHKNSFTFRGTAPLLGKGLLFNDGDMWRRKRRIISKFFTHEILLSNVGNIGDIVDRVLDKT